MVFRKRKNEDVQKTKRVGEVRPIVKIIYAIQQGIIPNVNIKGAENLPFKLQRSESLLYAWVGVKYYETRAVRQWKGGNKGVRVRVAKGLSFNVGRTSGSSVSKDEITHVDTGYMAITNKHIHFNGDVKGFRIKFDKIISLEHKRFKRDIDALELMRDLANPKPQIFQFADVAECIALINAVESME